MDGKVKLPEEHFPSHPSIEDGKVERGELVKLFSNSERMGCNVPKDKTEDEYEGVKVELHLQESSETLGVVKTVWLWLGERPEFERFSGKVSENSLELEM